MYTYTKQNFDSNDNVIKLMESCLTDSGYYNWKNLNNLKRYEGFDPVVFNSYTYDSTKRIEGIVNYFNDKIDVVGNTIIINPFEDIKSLIYRTDDLVYNYKDDDQNIFKMIIDGNFDKCMGFFINFDNDYFVENIDGYNMSLTSLYNSRQYECYSNTETLPIYELLGSIYTTDIGIYIEKNEIIRNDNIITINVNDELTLKSPRLTIDNDLLFESKTSNKLILNTQLITLTKNSSFNDKLVFDNGKMKLINFPRQNGDVIEYNDYEVFMDAKDDNKFKVKKI